MSSLVEKIITSTTNIFVLATIIIFFSCEKGDPGPIGPAGEIGIPGKDGSQFLSGNGAPNASLGTVGDMYLEFDNAWLYGPKTAQGWGEPISLRGNAGPAGPAGPPGPAGATGATGAAGSKIYAGTGNPLVNVGIIGDYYIDSSTGDLYGPKLSNNTWGSPIINLKGTANVIGTNWINTSWIPNSYPQSFQHIVPNPFLNAVGVTDMASLHNSGGIVLVYLRAIQSPNSPNDYWQWQIPSQINSYWNVDVRWGLNGNNVNVLVVNASEIAGSNFYLDLSAAQFRYVIVPAGSVVELQAKGFDLERLDVFEVERLLKN